MPLSSLSLLTVQWPIDPGHSSDPRLQSKHCLVAYGYGLWGELPRKMDGS